MGNLGVLFDSGLLFSKQMNSIGKSCYLQMRDICTHSSILMKLVSITMANAIVSSLLTFLIHFSKVVMTMFCAEYRVFRILNVALLHALLGSPHLWVGFS